MADSLRMHFIGAVATLLIFGSSAFLSSVYCQEIVQVSSRAGVTKSFLLISPKGGLPEASAVLFPGGMGDIRLRTEEGQVKFAPNNFLVRARNHFVDRGVAVAILDSPTDQANGMSNAFRKSEVHARDVQFVVAELKRRFPGIPVHLVGTSMGSVSVAYVGRVLEDEVAGIVLTSSPFVASGRRSVHGDSNLSDFDLRSIRARFLITHHRDDRCGICPYSEAQRRAERFPFISVNGGQPPQSDPCQALSAHGYLGKEEDVVDAIVKWMLGRPFRHEIN